MVNHHVLTMLEASAKVFLNDVSARSDPKLWTVSGAAPDRRKSNRADLVPTHAQTPHSRHTPEGERP